MHPYRPLQTQTPWCTTSWSAKVLGPCYTSQRISYWADVLIVVDWCRSLEFETQILCQQDLQHKFRNWGVNLIRLISTKSVLRSRYCRPTYDSLRLMASETDTQLAEATGWFHCRWHTQKDIKVKENKNHQKSVFLWSGIGLICWNKNVKSWRQIGTENVCVNVYMNVIVMLVVSWWCSHQISTHPSKDKKFPLQAFPCLVICAEHAGCTAVLPPQLSGFFKPVLYGHCV